MNAPLPSLVRRLALALVAISLAAVAPRPLHAEEQAARTRMTPEVLWSLKRLGAPSISPDGKWAAIAVTQYDIKEDKGKTDIWLVPTAGGDARRLTSHDAADTHPEWSPDGAWIAFESKREGDDENQIYVISVTGGEARRLTKVPTGAEAARWFPDSRRIAFISWVWKDLATWEDQGKRLKERKDSKRTAKVWDKPIIRWWDHWVEDRDPHLYSVGLDGDEPRAITMPTGRCLPREEPGADSYDISPDGMEVAFASDVDPTGVDQNYDILVAPIAGGDARDVSLDNKADDSTPKYSPDGKWLSFGRQTIKDFYADRVRLVLHDRSSKENRIVTESFDRSVGGLIWAFDSKTIYGAIDDAGNQRVYRIEIPSGKPSPLTQERSFSGLSISREGGVLVAIRQSFVEPPTLVKVDMRSGEATKLSTFNDEILSRVDFGTYERVTYDGAGGEEIQMWINYPPGFDRSRRWPLFLLLHGGPHNGVTDAWQPRWNAQVFSGWGYVTAWHNFHGSSGFGQKFTDSINPNQSELPYEDTILAAKFLATRTWIDPVRMAAGGGSFGGYLAAILLGRDHPFKTLIAHAAVYNWYTQYGSDYGAGKRRFGEHWENPDVFQISSPHFGAKNFKTPTLVIHGQLDYRVPLNQGIELFQTLQNRGVKSRLIYYPDENHWVLKPNNSLFWYTQVRDWIKEFIGAGPTE